MSLLSYYMNLNNMVKVKYICYHPYSGCHHSQIQTTYTFEGESVLSNKPEPFKLLYLIKWYKDNPELRFA